MSNSFEFRRGGDFLLKKINASSDIKLEDGFLPSETLWKAAHILRQKGGVDLQLIAEPKPHEILGLTIGMVRRRKHITLGKLANKTGLSIEELLAFESGLLPISELIKYLPVIIREVKIPKKRFGCFYKKLEQQRPNKKNK